jgi:hypothetical protein
MAAAMAAAAVPMPVIHSRVVAAQIADYLGCGPTTSEPWPG